MRPTKRAVLLFALLLPIPWFLLVANLQLWPLSLDVSLFVLIGLAADLAMAYSPESVDVSASLPDVSLVGETTRADITIALERPALRPRRMDLALDVSGTGEPQVRPRVHRMSVEGSQGRVTIPIAPQRRGIVVIDAVWARWQGPLGLIERTRVFSVDERCSIVPAVYASQTASFELSTRDALLGSKAQLDLGGGLEFEALREHARGQDVRFVDWKHTARHRRLLFKEFRAERNHPVVLAFDTGHLMREPIDGVARLDHSINSGLLFARLALRSGDLVGTYSFDVLPGTFRAPEGGMQSFRRLQRASAGLSYGTDETNFTLGLSTLYSRLDRRSLVILFTDFVDTVTAEILIENVKRLAQRHLVVFIALRNPLLADVFAAPPSSPQRMAQSVIGYDLAQERTVVLERLRRLGVQCLDVPAARLSVDLINRYIAIKQRGML